MEKKYKDYKKSPPSLSALNQWVQQKGRKDKRVRVYTAVEVLLWKAQPLKFSSLQAEKFILQDFLSIPVFLIGSAC